MTKLLDGEKVSSFSEGIGEQAKANLVPDEVTRSLTSATDGLLVVDKPLGLSSHQVVSRVRRLVNNKKVGHSGTLDPQASGVLICGVGRATRLLHYLLGEDKTYLATIRFGIGTNTDDAAGEITAEPGMASLDTAKLEEALACWRGAVQQVPASVSAIKIDGKRAYAKVRAGQDVQLKARLVVISRLEYVGEIRLMQAPGSGPDPVAVADVDVVVDCSAGTYIRALARDLGKELGTAAHLTALRRTRVGAFNLDQAATLAQLNQQVLENNQAQPPRPLELLHLDQAALSLFAPLEVSESTWRALSYGQQVSIAHAVASRQQKALESSSEDQLWAAQNTQGQVVALVQRRANRVAPVFVMYPSS